MRVMRIHNIYVKVVGQGECHTSVTKYIHADGLP